MVPIIFLDVDGVLNHRGVFTQGCGVDPLCPNAIKRLLGLIETTGAKIVLSSTWRLGGKESRQVAKLAGAGVMAHAHDDWSTVDLPVEFHNGLVVMDDPRRGREIKEWLDRHPEHSEFVIIDDDSDMMPDQMPRFVKTSFDTGLLDAHCDRAAAILSTNPQ